MMPSVSEREFVRRSLEEVSLSVPSVILVSGYELISVLVDSESVVQLE